MGERTICPLAETTATRSIKVKMYPAVMCERAKQRNQCFPTNTEENNLGKAVIKDIFFLCSSVNHIRSTVGHTVTKKVFRHNPV